MSGELRRLCWRAGKGQKAYLEGREDHTVEPSEVVRGREALPKGCEGSEAPPGGPGGVRIPSQKGQEGLKGPI